MLLNELMVSEANERNSDIPDKWTVKDGGKTVYVNISPYSWMTTGIHDKETGYSLSLGENYPNIGREFFTIKKLYHDLKKKDIDAMISTWLKAGNLKKLEAAEDKWNEHNTSSRASAVKRGEESKKTDDAQAKKGMKFKVVAIVEPKAGDDYSITWYTEAKPSASEIAKVLKSKRSESTTNYKITSL